MRAWIPVVIAVGAFSAAVAFSASVGAQATDLSEITIAGPAINTVGRDAYGSRIRQLSGIVRVHYNPLMLTTNSGRALLDAKVAEVARTVCSANGIFPNVDDSWNCVGRAIKAAESKLDAATAQVRLRLAQGRPIPQGSHTGHAVVSLLALDSSIGCRGANGEPPNEVSGSAAARWA